jgi:CheY-like chemotaxis protein
MAANPALTSILAAMLAEARALRVRQFESQHALTTYMRIAPVDLLVADFDCDNAPADRLARTLRQDGMLARHDFQVVALARALPAGAREVAMASGIDEVIVKPMSPRYLLERVLSRLGEPSPMGLRRVYRRRGLRMRPPGPDYSRYGDNVVSLLAHRLAAEELLH